MGRTDGHREGLVAEKGAIPTLPAGSPLAHASPLSIPSSLENLIACSFHSAHQFDLHSRVQPRFTLFCLNNAGSEAIDKLSSARKWLRHGQACRGPGASASHRSSPGNGKVARSEVDRRELEASVAFSRRQSMGKFYKKARAGAPGLSSPPQSSGKEARMGLGATLSHFLPEDVPPPCLPASWPQQQMRDL